MCVLQLENLEAAEPHYRRTWTLLHEALDIVPSELHGVCVHSAPIQLSSSELLSCGAAGEPGGGRAVLQAHVDAAAGGAGRCAKRAAWRQAQAAPTSVPSQADWGTADK